MIRMTFQSGLKEKEKQFVAFKQQFGHTYEARIYNLLDFDRFCAANYSGRDTLDRDIVLKWAVIRPTETANGFATRISAVRQFGKYLAMLGEDAYIIPDGFRGGDMPLMPYIFSEATLRQFLGYTDSMERYYQSTVRHLVAPVMFRFMYCCGLRPCEARNLDRADINFENGRVFIRESKHYKERVVYAPDSLMPIILEYMKDIDCIFPDRQPLFIDRNGIRYSYGAQQYLFEHCRDHSGIKWSGTKAPNLYSFRHTFATHRIYRWFKEGKDLGAYLPKLSAYMGHSHYEHTLYYLHFVPDIFSDMTGFDFERFSYLIPEVAYHE